MTFSFLDKDNGHGPAPCHRDDGGTDTAQAQRREKFQVQQPQQDQGQFQQRPRQGQQDGAPPLFPLLQFPPKGLFRQCRRVKPFKIAGLSHRQAPPSTVSGLYSAGISPFPPGYPVPGR